MAFSIEPVRDPFNKSFLGLIIRQDVDKLLVVPANEIDTLIEALRVFSSQMAV